MSRFAAAIRADASPIVRLFVVFLLVLSLGLGACEPADPLEQIREMHAVGDFAGSLEPLRELLAERPGDLEVHYLYGRALDLTGQSSLAEWSLRKAMGDPELLVPAGLQLAYGALASGNFATVFEATGKILEVEPDNLNALLIRANAHAHSRRNPTAALEDSDRILAIDPENIEVMEPRILSLLALDRIEEAAAAIEDLGRRIEETDDPGTLGWHCATTAIFADESKETELAEERWERCLERYPGHPNVVTNGLRYYDKKGDLDRSLEILRAALATDPSSSDYRYALAGRLRAGGRNQEAEQLLREATEAKNPNVVVVAWLTLAEHYQAVGDYAAGAAATRRAIEIAEQIGFEHPHLPFEHAEALVLAGDLDEAERVAQQMSLPAHRELILALVAQRRGQPVVALAHYDEAFRHWPDNAAARYEAARAAEAAGDFDRAIEAYRYAIRIDAAATDARTRLGRLHAAEGQPGVAIQAMRVRIDRAPLDPEGRRLYLRLHAQVGKSDQVRRALLDLRERRPDELGATLASVAEGLRDRAGPKAAVGLLRQAEAVDFEDPRDAEALRALVTFSAEADELAAAAATVDAALAAHPESPVFHAIRGRAHELAGQPDRARQAYERSLELAAENPRALVGLGRLALESDPEAALGYLDRALAIVPADSEALEASARAHAATGRYEQAVRSLVTLLRADPYDGAAAAQLAELDLERGVVTDRTLAMAQRAARFGGGADALELVARVHERRGEPDKAVEAASRARKLREAASPDA